MMENREKHGGKPWSENELNSLIILGRRKKSWVALVGGENFHNCAIPAPAVQTFY